MAGRSSLSNFVTFLSAINDDLSNITSPPSFLAPLSVTEMSACWAERPKLFVAPTFESSPERRCLAVLKWIVASHRRQFYISKDVEVGIKKPLNSFLGEIFQEQWTDDVSTTRLVAEQVSYQPAITACYITSDEHRVWGDGFSRINMSFNGTLVIRQTGYATLHLDQHNEHYLIQLPNIEVRGFIAGRLYPELSGTYHIVSSSSVVADVTYSGKWFMSGAKNEVFARVFRKDDETQTAVYTLSGCWSDRFSIFDMQRGQLIEEWSHLQHPPAKMQPRRASDQRDKWEASRAWHEVKAALASDDLLGAVAAKLQVENAQRAMRAVNPQYDSQWQPLFFTKSLEPHPSIATLASAFDDWSLNFTETEYSWRYDATKAAAAIRPYHDDKDPVGLMYTVVEGDMPSYFVYDVDNRIFKPVNTICETQLPQQQRDYLRQKRFRKQVAYGQGWPVNGGMFTADFNSTLAQPVHKLQATTHDVSKYALFEN